DANEVCRKIAENEYVSSLPAINSNLGTGIIDINVSLLPELYYQIMSELCGIRIDNDEELFLNIKRLATIKKEYDKIATALEDVNSTGYGIVLPEVDDMTLAEPEISKQGGAYGIKLKASAPSIHMIKTSISTEINPIVGSAEQSEEIVRNMLDEYEDDPKRLWESNMFGKSLYELVNDGLNKKLEHISDESKAKLSDTLTRVINEGSNGLICILL
ncbi:MAG: stage IV sporulation protein A, partial [Clostridia bacterium]|nr:stage IV sporulation protein A [Clostridia bacterium]